MAKANVIRETPGWTWEIGYLPPKQALKVLTRLSKVLGEPIGLATDAFFGKGNDKPVGAEVEEVDAPATVVDRQLPEGLIGKCLRALTDKLDEATVTDTVDLLLTVVQAKGPGDNGTRRLNPLKDFEGEPALMLRVAGFALEVNFADFFGGAGVSGAIMARVKEAAAGLSTPAKSTSTGQSGA